MRRNPNMLLSGCSLYWFHQRDGLAVLQGRERRPDRCGRAVNQQRQSFLRWHSENRACMQKMCLPSFLLPPWNYYFFLILSNVLKIVFAVSPSRVFVWIMLVRKMAGQIMWNGTLCLCTFWKLSGALTNGNAPGGSHVDTCGIAVIDSPHPLFRKGWWKCQMKIMSSAQTRFYSLKRHEKGIMIKYICVK